MPRKPKTSGETAPSLEAAARQAAGARRPAAHGRFDYSPIVDRPRAALAERRPRRALGDPQHRAFPVRPAGDAISGGGMPVNPDVLNYSWRDYGVRVGIWRHDGDDGRSYGVRGTVALNSDVCREYPRIIEEGNKLGWEWMGHGITNSILLNAQSEAEERALISEVVARSRQERRQGAARLAQPGIDRDRAHARHPRRERHRIRRQLGQRRAALSDAGEEGLDDLDALFVGDQRHPGAARACTRARSVSAR